MFAGFSRHYLIRPTWRWIIGIESLANQCASAYMGCIKRRETSAVE
jgi:hypothetical protein